MKSEAEAERKTTLGVLGARLPLGTPAPDGTLLTDLTVVDYYFKQEREIAELIQERNARSMGEYINAVLSVLVSRMGGVQLDKLSLEQRRLALNRCYAGDVLYAYCYARYAALGKDIKFSDLTCPFCRHVEDEVVADLRELEVRRLTAAEQFEEVVKLPSGGLLYRGTRRGTVTLRASRWEVFDMPEEPTSMAELAERTLYSIITGLEGIPADEALALEQADLDTLRKPDYELLLGRADRLSGGPVMSLLVNCVKCRRPARRALEWDFNSFFGVSSR